jgi:hypothetical protein
VWHPEGGGVASPVGDADPAAAVAWWALSLWAPLVPELHPDRRTMTTNEREPMTLRPLIALALFIAAVALAAYVAMSITGPATSHAQAGPTIPAPDKQTAQMRLATSLEASCRKINKLVSIKGSLYRTGSCLSYTKWYEVDCSHQPGFTRRNRGQRDRWKCSGTLRWETSVFTTEGPCFAEAVEHGIVRPGFPVVLVADRVGYTFTGKDGAVAQRVLPWRCTGNWMA